MGFFPTDIDAQLLTETSVTPQDASGTDIAGSSVNRVDFLSCQVVVAVGAAEGAPTSFTVDAKLQESSDESTWTDVTGAAITQITVDNTTETIGVNLKGTKEFVRIFVESTFTGGTSPVIQVVGHVVKGGAVEKPAV